MSDDTIPITDPTQIPAFASQDDEAAFWDTHEITDELWAKLEPVAGDEPIEPHLNVWRLGSCVHCGEAGSWVVVAIPKLSTGEQFPQFGVCEVCDYRIDLKGSPPFLVAKPDAAAARVPVRGYCRHCERMRSFFLDGPAYTCITCEWSCPWDELRSDPN